MEDPGPRLNLELLRATPLRKVLRRGGLLFKDSEGSAETYALSSQVRHIDTFISHTWRTPQRKKFLALSFHFGFFLAYAVSLLFGALVLTLGALRVLPYVELSSIQGLQRVPNGPYGLLLCPVMFWLFLGLQSDLVPPLPFREHQVFLDKVCIHQTDTILKTEGVAHLGMFLFFSGELVVLETDDYLQRLWTVYEISTFLLLQPEGRLVILPVNLPPIVLVGCIFCTIVELLSFVCRLAALNRVLPVAVNLSFYVGIFTQVPAVLILVSLMRRWALEQQRRAAHLLHRFSISSAECAQESDRRPVMANITNLVEHMRSPDNDAEDATAKFDTLVRDNVPKAIQQSVGCSGVPYTHLLTLNLCYLGELFDAVGSEIAAGSSLQEAFPRCWFWVAWHFGGYPMSIALGSLLTRRCLHFHDLFGNLYVGVVSIVVLIAGFLSQVLFTSLRARAVNSSAFSFAFVVVTGFMFIFAYLVLQPRNRSRRSKRSTSDSDMLNAARRLGLQIRFPVSASSPGSTSSTASSSSIVANVASSTLGRTSEVVGSSASQTPTRPVVRMSL